MWNFSSIDEFVQSNFFKEHTLKVGIAYLAILNPQQEVNNECLTMEDLVSAIVLR
jgi:hypothetical protein